MRRLLILPFLLAALSLAGGCTTFSTVGSVVSTVTATIDNPIDTVDIHRARIVYNGILELAVGYRRYCWSRPYSELMKDSIAKPLCRNRRAVVRKLKAADDRAFAALTKAEAFVRDNPTINAATMVRAAWDAVTVFQRAVPRV